MTRMLRLTLAFVVVALALEWAPGIPPYPLFGVAQVRAQQFPGVIAPGGTIMYSGASISCVNTANECSAYQYTIPAAYLATATTVGAVSSQYYTGDTATGLRAPVLWNTPQPLHLSMAGYVAGNSGASYQVGVNLGGTAATLGMANTLASTQGLQPIQLDVYITPIASVTATQSAVNNVFIYARLTTGAASTVAATATQIHTLTGMNLASPAQLNVLTRWQAGATSSTITWFKRLLKVGD